MIITQQQKEKYDKIRMLDRNFDDEMKVDLWAKYHFLNKKGYELLYYDRK